MCEAGFTPQNLALQGEIIKDHYEFFYLFLPALCIVMNFLIFIYGVVKQPTSNKSLSVRRLKSSIKVRWS